MALTRRNLFSSAFKSNRSRLTCTYFDGFDKEHVSSVACPDNLAFDEHGSLYAIAVAANSATARNASSPSPRMPKTCGPIAQRQRVLVNVQYPGDNVNMENPTSHWPDGSNIGT